MATQPDQQSRSTRPAAALPSSSGESSERPAKFRRIRLACLRCQTRKIKCDGAIPKCHNCYRAGVECVDGKKTYSEGSISRSDATTLLDQIRRLEEVLRERCPDVNIDELATASTAAPIEGARNDLAASLPTEAQAVPERPRTSTLGIARTQAARWSNEVPPDILSPGTPNQNAAAEVDSPAAQQQEIAHEIGLIPLSSGVSKYVGPSSGFSFAKMVFARADQVSPGTSQSVMNHESPSMTISRSMFHIGPTAIPPTIDQAIQLSKIYFEYVHVQYPFLHEPTHSGRIREVYSNSQQASLSTLFQVTMVLAISATILSKRLRIPFTGEGLCATAMEHANSVDFQNSTQGVQCLLLVAMFTLHSPFLGINPWYLNYQCLAAVLDLGLQRDIPTGPSVSVFEREMRTRIFWVIYSIDRTLATTLGRPIGLRDEACDLRLPEVYEDGQTESEFEALHLPHPSFQRPGAIACSIVLFKLAQLNSEIKYILHSITRGVPKYTYPQIPDIAAWQADLHQRLQATLTGLPAFADDEGYLTRICQIRYHEIAMLLFRPTPRIPTPAKESLLQCHKSAEVTIKSWKELYDSDRMSYSWITIHSLCLSVITMLYCIWMVPEITATTRLDELTSTMQASSNILSAAGEHWNEARRSRNKLDELVAATIRWLVDLQSNQRVHQQNSRSKNPSQTPDLPDSTALTAEESQPFEDLPYLDFPGVDAYINREDLACFVGAPDPFATDFSLTLEGMFSQYQPLFDFNPQQDFATSFLG